MTTSALNLFLWGALTMASWVASLFFLRFWRSSGERLFVFLAIAFCLLGLNWLCLALINWGPEARHQAYVLRLLAFALIIVAIVDKNRNRSD